MPLYDVPLHLTRPSPMLRRALAGAPPRRYVPGFGDVGDGFLTTLDNSFRSLFGLSPLPGNISAYLTQAQSDTNTARGKIQGIDTQIKTLQAQVQAFDNNASPDVRSRAQAVEAEATGLLNAFDALSASLLNLAQEIQAALSAVANSPASSANSPAGMTVDSTSALQLSDAQSIATQASSLLVQAKTLAGKVPALSDDVNSVISYAQGKGLSALVSQVEGGFTSVASGVGATLSSSVSTMVWVGSIGLAAYLFLPGLLGRALHERKS